MSKSELSMCCYSSNFSSNFFHPLWKKLLPNMDWPNLTPGPNPRYLLFFVDFEIQGQFMVVIRSVLVDLKSNHGPELDFGFSMMEFPSFDSKFWTSAKNGAFWVPISMHLGENLKNSRFLIKPIFSFADLKFFYQTYIFFYQPRDNGFLGPS